METEQIINLVSWLITILTLGSKLFSSFDLEKILFNSIVQKLGYVRKVEMGVLIAKIVRKFANIVTIIKAAPDKLLTIILALESAFDSIIKQKV